MLTVRLHHVTWRLRAYTEMFATIIGLLLLTPTPSLDTLLIIEVKRKYTIIM